MTAVSRFTRRLVLVLATGAMLAPALRAAETATEDPAAQAAHYSKQAADLRASADRHAQMAKAHRAGAGSPKVAHESIAAHCERLAEELRAAAQESDAIAETYRSLAEKKQ